MMRDAMRLLTCKTCKVIACTIATVTKARMNTGTQNANLCVTGASEKLPKGPANAKKMHPKAIVQKTFAFLRVNNI